MKHLLLISATLLLAAALLLGLFSHAPTPSVATIGGPFRLTTGTNTEVTDETFRGRYMLVYFGYTKCRDVCPATLNNLAAALAKLDSAASARLQPLFITVDPARDTPSVVQRYTQHFSPSLIGLTGAPADISRAEAAYRVSSVSHPGPQALIDHSAVLYLMAPDGSFVAPIRADASAREMARDLVRLVR